LFHRFKKCKFLAPKEGNQKNLFYKGRIKRKEITGGKNKTRPHYTGYQPIVFLGEGKTKPAIISNSLGPENEEKLITVLKRNKEALGWSTRDL
jgi:hypothetical protein